MNKQEYSHLAWLFAALGSQRTKLAGLLQRLRGLGMPGAMKSSVFRKFLNMLDQVSTAREKEYAILCRIEVIEAQHRFSRTHNGLRYAAPEPQRDLNYGAEYEAECERPGNGWVWFLATVAFLSGRNQPEKA